MIYLKIAWRNIFRNRRRTIITGIAIGLGLASLMFVDSMMIGMEDNMRSAATDLLIGHGQIHQKDFRRLMNVEGVINNIGKVVENLQKEEIIDIFTERVYSFGMITSTYDVGAVELIGVEPEKERYIARFDDALVEGSFFESDSDRDIVIGRDLADTLSAGIGDRVVVTVARANTDKLSQEMFRISGIFKFSMREMDSVAALIRIKKAQDMVGIGADAHEIALRFKDSRMALDKELFFWDKYSADGNEAVSWTVIMPEIEAALELSAFSMMIVSLILFSIVLLIIMNTLFMSLYERMFEFGVLRAVGTRPFSVAKLIIYEAGSLSVVSIAIGSIIGALAIMITAYYGIDYTGIEFSGIVFSKLLYPVLRAEQFLYYPAQIFVFSLISGIYPAVYAARMSAVKAMRKSM